MDYDLASSVPIALHNTPGVPQFIGGVPFPGWATPRGLDWTYTGWFPKDEGPPGYKELIRRSLPSDHGETREVDEYPEGATCWFREKPCVEAAPRSD